MVAGGAARVTGGCCDSRMQSKRLTAGLNVPRQMRQLGKLKRQEQEEVSVSAPVCVQKLVYSSTKFDSGSMS